MESEREQHNLSFISMKDVALFSSVFIIGIAATWSYLVHAQHVLAEAEAHQAAAVSAVATSSEENYFASLSLVARSAIVVDLVTGKTLYALNPDASLPLASLTKVPMAFVVTHALPADTVVTIPTDTSPVGSVEHLGKGEKWKLQDVVHFTLIASSNGGAEILAAAADKDIRAAHPDAPAGGATVWGMNKLAQSLGLTDMYFLNPSGLDESTSQAGSYGSARSVARLFAYVASTSPEVFAGTTRARMQLKSLDGHTTTAINTDEALDEIPGVIMGKTGYTDLAGGNLAVVFDVGLAHPVVVVVMHSTETGRFDDMKKLVDATIHTLSHSSVPVKAQARAGAVQ
jgi:D-alanyl-D-alanine carboxypeptidase